MQGAHMRARIATQLGSQTSAGTRPAQTSDDKAYIEMFRRRVMSLRHQGRFSRCLEANEKVLEQFPTSVTALCLKSEVLLRIKKSEDALKAAERAAESGETLQECCTGACCLRFHLLKLRLECFLHEQCHDPGLPMDGPIDDEVMHEATRSGHPFADLCEDGRAHVLQAMRFHAERLFDIDMLLLRQSEDACLIPTPPSILLTHFAIHDVLQYV